MPNLARLTCLILPLPLPLACGPKVDDPSSDSSPSPSETSSPTPIEACGFTPTDPACGDCLATHCCPEIEACGEVPECECVLICAEEAGEEDNLAACIADCYLPILPDALTMLSECQGDHCEQCL